MTGAQQAQVMPHALSRALRECRSLPSTALSPRSPHFLLRERCSLQAWLCPPGTPTSFQQVALLEVVTGQRSISSLFRSQSAPLFRLPCQAGSTPLLRETGAWHPPLCSVLSPFSGPPRYLHLGVGTRVHLGRLSPPPCHHTATLPESMGLRCFFHFSTCTTHPSLSICTSLKLLSRRVMRGSSVDKQGRCFQSSLPFPGICDCPAPNSILPWLLLFF